MYDLASKFNTFYDSYVVLPQDEQTKLYEKKDKNIQRLREGLDEYNIEHETSYKILDTRVQGSMSMSTIVQNEDNDYDIDIAVVFDKSCIGDIGPRALRNVIADSLKRKTKAFNAEPEVKTSCVRIKYADGYHVDFAIFRREWDEFERTYIYKHAGSEWTQRGVDDLKNWFVKENDNSNGNLRRVVRLSKMFCKSRESWKNMPSGLLQTILCQECLVTSYDRIDQLFYYTMKSIIDRLERTTSVRAPVDNGRNLTPRKSDINRLINWKNRLKSKIEDLEILFKEKCSSNDALQAWYGFFKHDYWKGQTTLNDSYSLTHSSHSVKVFDDTEEFIEDKFDVALCQSLEVSCEISGDGFRPKPILDFLGLLRKFLPHNLKIVCTVVKTSTSYPYDVYWKIKNVGPEAERRNQIRGQIINKGNSIVEHTRFFGNHYIECYIVKDGICVARRRIDVPIGRG